MIFVWQNVFRAEPVKYYNLNTRDHKTKMKLFLDILLLLSLFCDPMGGSKVGERFKHVPPHHFTVGFPCVSIELLTTTCQFSYQNPCDSGQRRKIHNEGLHDFGTQIDELVTRNDKLMK